MKEGILKKNNVNITGNPDARQTIVFGHGFGTDQHSFSEVIKPFLPDYRVVLFDNVGGGNADIGAFSQERYKTLDGYVTDLTDIFNVLGLKDVIYVGHSVNGMISMLAAIKNPDLFSRLIFLGASPRYLNEASTGYVGGFDQEALDGLYQAMATNYQAWVSGFSNLVTANPDAPHVAENFARTLSVVRPDIALSVAKAIFETDHRADLPKNTKPVLIVQTSNDIAVPVAVGDYMHANIPNSKLTQVATNGHFPQLSAPGEVIAAIQSFI